MARLDVRFGAHDVAPADVQGKVAAVIDVLRASTSIAVALAAGAKSVIPLATPDDVVTRAKAFERGDVRLAGERRMQPVPGFDLGNSPREFTAERVGGKTILFTTTNGTPALLSCGGARDVVVASYVNFSATLALLRSALRGGTDVTIVCAGSDRAFALEDAVCAGRFVRRAAQRTTGVTLSDAAVACGELSRKHDHDLRRMFAQSSHGRALEEAGYGEDLDVCAALDAYPVVPLFHDRQITRLGPEHVR